MIARSFNEIMKEEANKLAGKTKEETRVLSTKDQEIKQLEDRRKELKKNEDRSQREKIEYTELNKTEYTELNKTEYTELNKTEYTELNKTEYTELNKTVKKKRTNNLTSDIMKLGGEESVKQLTFFLSDLRDKKDTSYNGKKRHERQ